MKARTTICLLVSKLFLENKLASLGCWQPSWPLPTSPPSGLHIVLFTVANAGGPMANQANHQSIKLLLPDFKFYHSLDPSAILVEFIKSKCHGSEYLKLYWNFDAPLLLLCFGLSPTLCQFSLCSLIGPHMGIQYASSKAVLLIKISISWY